ncbi:MAG TPA: polysaccharide biosynthesis tyrosine autokinase, partial [Pseudothauera hydrothermalis]|nr:polysaccharide biosynthesis tyrosine autokinase [Pseudothauera hydrothermalis]
EKLPRPFLEATTKLEETERFLQELTNNAQSAGFSSDESGILRKLLQLEFQLAEIRGQRELAEANIAAYDSRLRELKVPEQPGLASMNSPEVVQLQRELELLVNQRERLSSSGASRQQLVEIEQKIAEKRDALFKKIIQTQDMPSGNIAMEQNLADQIRQNRVKEELELYMLRNRERYFSQLLQRYRNENPRIVDRAIEEAQLKRSKMVYENLYSILLEKGEEARIRAATSLGGIRIIDAPHLPESPIPVNYVRNILLGLILALGLGVGLAMGREYFDNTIRNKEELARRTGLSVIGVVPEMHSHKTSDGRDLPKKENQPRSTTAAEFDRSSNGYAGHLISQMKPRDPVVDAYRTLRTNLQFASTDQPISALMVTSALPGEGKTLSAANVAISFAELGQRVLLIDGDMRKPMQHTIFGVNSIPGLSDSMIKGYGVSQVVRQTGVPNLRLVPCGTIPPNPAEMIASRRMADFIGQCRQMFDLVVVDTPPVRLVTDPLLFAAKTPIRCWWSGPTPPRSAMCRKPCLCCAVPKSLCWARSSIR